MRIQIIYTFCMPSNFSSNGLNTFDLLGDLTPQQRALTRILLRHSELTEDALYEAIMELPENKRMSKAEMKDALKVLMEKKWIYETTVGRSIAYTIKQQHR